VTPVSTDYANPTDRDALLARARSELERRLRAREPFRVEELLSSFPALASHPDAAVELIVAEFLARRALGEQPDPAECCARFPQWRQRLECALAPLLSKATDASAETQATGRQAPPRPEAPAALGRHEVYEEIGCGGMGIVYRARDLVLGREVALKRIRSGALTGSEVDRFYREARAAALLRHPNIMPIYAIGLSDGSPCYTMPLLTGGSLADHDDRYRHDPRAAAGVMAKVARAVQAAHDAGVVHRDLKPGNILLDAHGEPLVADFGLAKLADAGADVTCTGQAIGTPPYMAPEQISGERDQVGAATDVWALGIILYQLLTGARPFSGRGRRLEDEILTKEPAWPPALPAELGAITRACLRKRPQDRYAAAGLLAADLEAWLAGLPVRPPWRPAPRRRLWVALSCGLALFVALAAGVLALLPRDRPPDPLEAPEVLTAPGVWHPLLKREPVALRWHEGATNTHKVYQPEAGKLLASSEELALLQLGQTAARRYQLAVRFQQTPLVGNVGLFFGHQDCTVGGETGQRWQVLELVAEQPAGPLSRLRIDWKTYYLLGPPDRPRQVSKAHAVCSPLPVEPGEHRLELAVGPAGLESVSWDGRPLPRLSAAGGVNPPGPADYAGRFGIYLNNGGAVFREAGYLFREEPQ
jgi:hypothetical protein